MGNEVFQEVTLPSGGKLYGDGKAVVKLRTLKGKDEKLIAEINDDNFERKFALVLGNLIEGIDAGELTLGDRMHILLWEVINSQSPKYPVKLICEDCEKEVQVDIDLAEMESIGLDDLVEPKEVMLPDAGVPVKLRLFRVKDEIKIFEREKSGKPSWCYRYALTLVDDKMDIVQKESFIDELSATDLGVIRAFQEKYSHGPTMLSVYVCPKCGGGGDCAVPFRLEMLLPSAQTLVSRLGATI